MSINGSNIGKISVGDVVSVDAALAEARQEPHLQFTPDTKDLRRQVAMMLLRRDIGIIDHDYGDKRRKIFAEKRIDA